MIVPMKTSLLLASLLCLSSGAESEGEDAERKAVRRAVADYVDAVYDVKPELIERSVHPELAKVGFARRKPEDAYRTIPMTYQQLHELAAEYNADGSRANADSPRKIELLDVLDQTAVAKLTAQWGIDYFHLAKYEGKWKIIHVLWQSHPVKAAGDSGGGER